MVDKTFYDFKYLYVGCFWKIHRNLKKSSSLSLKKAFFVNSTCTMLIVIMDGISKEIFENEQKIESNFALYREKAKTLGLLALSDKEKLDILIGNSLLNELINSKQSHDAVKEIAEQREALEASIKEETKKADRSKSKVVELEKKKKEILSRLGAVALVQAQSDVACPEIAALLKDTIEEEKKAFAMSNSQSFLTKIKGRLKLKKIQKHQAKRVYNIGLLLDQKGIAYKVNGENGNSFALSLDKINRELNFHKGKVEHLTKNLEIKADEQLTAINDKEQLEEAELKLNEAAISYGIYLFENGSKWIGENTPDQELDLLSEMLVLQNEREALEARIKECHKEISIDELSLLISNDKKKIERLLIEKHKIEEEIEKINEHISLITDKIMDVKNHE